MKSLMKSCGTRGIEGFFNRFSFHTLHMIKKNWLDCERFRKN